MATGRCLCGEVTVATDGGPRDVHYCHCSMCRRATGGAFALLAWFRRDQVRWTGRPPAARRSSAIAVRGFCPTCGSPAYLAYDGSGQIALMAGLLDDAGLFAPSHHYGAESRLPWVDAGRDLPARPTAPDPRPVEQSGTASGWTSSEGQERPMASKQMDREQRIRERAHAIWVAEGCPEGRAKENWEAAEELTAHEENQELATKPVEPDPNPAEPLEAVENQGEFPTLTDQGEEVSYPNPDLRKPAPEGGR